MKYSKYKKVELLSPVGSMESLHAAILNGADAVYLGGKAFNARQYASNFNLDELKQAVEYAHIRGVKVYITVNILLDNKEIKEAIEYIKYLYNIDVDGLIVQDLGFANIIRNIFPHFPIHASTQMTINNLAGVLFLEEMGFERVVLARELSIEEINHIKRNSNIEIEGFIHGALCICYSGQCLMSSIIGGRSGNRGRCAQPCRMPYSIVKYDTRELVFKNYDKKYILSTKDLNTIDYLDKIIDSGVTSLKIEGRMKRPEYVATIVNKYRKVLNILTGQKSFKLTKQDKKEIIEIFNRGFTKGYILGDFGNKIISLDRPDNRGIYLGKVVNKDINFIYIFLEDDVQKGDGIEFSTDKGEYVGTTINVSGKKNSIVKIPRIKNVYKNSFVYKTSNISLLKKARQSYIDGKEMKIPIDMKIKIYIGKPIELVIKDDKNIIYVKSEILPQIAKKVVLSKQKVINQLSKLSNFPYYLKNIDILLEDGVFVSLSDLNSIRRKGIEILNDKRKNINHREKINDVKTKLNGFFKFDNIKKKTNCKKLSVKVYNVDQFKKINLNKLDRIYLNFIDGIENCIYSAKKHNKEVFISTDKILYQEDLDILKQKINLIKNDIDGISVSNIGTLKFIKDRFDLKIHSDIGLNVFNSYTVKTLKNNKVNSVTLSPELKLNQIYDICNENEILYEAIGYGYLPLMISKYCPLSLVKKCTNDKDCAKCSFRQGYGLKDRKGAIFNLVRRNRTTIFYNSVPFMLMEEVHKIYDKGIDMIRLDFSFEKENINEIQENFYDYINKKITKDEVIKICNYYKQTIGITKGHYFRGVL